MVYFVQNVQKYRRYKEFEIYVEISTGTTISQEMLKQTVNKNNIHVPVGVSQVSQLVVMILLIDDCYVMSLLVTTSRMNFVLYRNNNDIILLLPWHIVISGFYYIFYTFTFKILKNRRASNKFIFPSKNCPLCLLAIKSHYNEKGL